jgi:hypothetical protein
MKLREESDPKPAQPDQALSNKQSTLSLRTEPAAVGSTLDLYSPVIPSREFRLTRPGASSNSSGWGYIDRLFVPEVIDIGKVSVSCPFVTVIKRKNPLCLLSGLGSDEGRIAFILLKVSW